MTDPRPRDADGGIRSRGDRRVQRRRRGVVLAVGLAALMGVVSVAVEVANSAADTRQAGDIRFDTCDAALKQGRSNDKVTVVYFSASWCGWCQKMLADSFTDARVQALADQFTWAKVDIDQRQRLAAMFNVRGVPALRLLNAQGELLHQTSGYLPPAKLAKMLDEYKDKASAKGQRRKQLATLIDTQRQLETADSGPAKQQAVTEAVKLLADSSPQQRQQAKKPLLEMGDDAWPGLIALLTHKRLAMRPAAGQVLKESTAAELAYDPFAEKKARQKQASRWQAWIRKQTGAATQPGEPSPDTQPAERTTDEDR